MLGKLQNRLMLSVLFAVLTTGLAAQVKFYTQVSEAEISMGQPFQVQYIAEGFSDTPQIFSPNFSQFTVHDVFENKTTSVQSANLKLVIGYSRIIWLSAKRTGTFIIPGATAIINGKRMKSNPVKIIIRARRITAPTGFEKSVEPVPMTELSKLKPGDDLEKRVRENLFLRAESNKSSVYVGEAMLLSYKMYSRLRTQSRILKRPSLTGLSIVEMVDRYDREPEMENINGLLFYSSLVRKVQGFALQPGSMQLDIAEVASDMRFERLADRKIGSVGDILNGGATQSTWIDHTANLESNRLTIQVKPLPTQNQPAAFAGAVGNFSMTVTCSRNDIHPGDLVKILVKITGTGNIPLIVAPEIKWPAGVDTADPAVKEDFNKFIYPLDGYKSFEYTFAAPDTGNYIIPATDFVYFNPATHTYQVSRSDSIELKVTPGAARAAIDTTTENKTTKRPLQLYWFAVVAGIIVLWVTYQFLRPAKKTPAKQEQPKPVVQVDLLAPPRAALINGDILAFYQELARALWIATADYCQVQPSAVNKRNIAAVLGSRGIDEATINDLLAVLNECEWALYAPEHEISNAEAALQKATAVTDRLSR